MRARSPRFRLIAALGALWALAEAPVVADGMLAAPGMDVVGYAAERSARAVDAMLERGASLVAEAALDELRGGFESGGLQMSFGIERVVYINGALASVTSINVAELGQARGGQAGSTVALPAGTTVALIQNGTNNSFSAELSSSALATVIQNSLDDQQITAITTIDATVNSMELLRSSRLEQTVRDSRTLFR